MAEKFHIKKPLDLGYEFGQERSRKTYDTLIATGFKLLEKNSFESITVALLTREAGYSVGAFYSRFRSKDEYFSSLLQHHIDVRLATNKRILENNTPATVVEALLSDNLAYFYEHHNFWRALIIRNAPDPNTWEPLRKLGEDNARHFVEYVQNARGRKLKAVELTNLMFAFQAFRSIINNTIINNPGPFNLGEKDFVKNLIRAFYLISDYNNLLKAK